MKMVKLLLLASILTPFCAHADDGVSNWKIIPEKSSIQWVVHYSGRPVSGSFSIDSYSTIQFDPAQLNKSNVDIAVPIDSLKTDDKDARENLPGMEWLGSQPAHPATFYSKQFRHVSGDAYEAEGILRMHGAEAKETFPFTLKITNGHAVMDGSMTIKRLDFNIGKDEAEFARTDILANEVKVTVHIEAQ